MVSAGQYQLREGGEQGTVERLGVQVGADHVGILRGHGVVGRRVAARNGASDMTMKLMGISQRRGVGVGR
jgi:hypothetical protein